LRLQWKAALRRNRAMPMSDSKDDLTAIRSRMLAKTFYLAFFEPTETGQDRHRVTREHFAYLSELERRGKLFAAGPFVDEEGKSAGVAMYILRASSAQEASELAAGDPYHIHGHHRFRVQAWRVNEGGFNIRVSFTDGTYVFD
jgi:hypothetical protein